MRVGCYCSLSVVCCWLLLRACCTFVDVLTCGVAVGWFCGMVLWFVIGVVESLVFVACGCGVLLVVW